MNQTSRRFLLIAGLLAAAISAGAPAAPAQDAAPGEGRPSGGSPLEDLQGRVPYSTQTIERGEFIISIVGSPSLRRRDLSVDAESVVLWFDPSRLRKSGGQFADMLPREEAGREAPPAEEGKPSTPAERPEALPFRGEQPLGPLAGSKDLPDSLREYLGPVLHALYAEGNVVFRMGNRTLRCDRLYIDFRRNLLVTGRVQLTVSVGNFAQGRTLPLLMRAERMSRNAEGSLVMKDASFGTCDFGDPHYRFQTSEIVITDEEDHVSFTSYHNVPKIGEVPIFYIPVLGGRSDLSARPLRSISYGSSSRFGQEVSLTWADRIDYGDEPWGEWRVHTDWKGDRGPGIGPEVEYDYGNARGELKTYWQKDNAETDDFDKSPVPKSDRGRVRWEHRQKLSPIWRLDFSLFDFSDRNYQREFLKDEALEDRDPETYAYLRYRDGTDLASLSVKPRLDDFTTTTTELPAGAFRRIGAEGPGGGTLWGLLDGSTWSMDVTAGAYERAYDEDLGIRGDRELREEAVGRLEGVKWVGPASVAPFFVAGGTTWQGLDAPGVDGDRSRGDLAVGVRASVEARRAFPGAESGFFDFNGLDHLAMLEVQAYDRFAVTEDPLETTAVDSSDTLEEVRVLGLRLRNRLQAERAGRRIDWIDLELRGHWFPDGLDGRTSPLGYKEEGLEGPRFQDFRGEGKYRSHPPRGDWGPLEGDLRIWAREDLYLLGEAEYDVYERATTTAAVGARWFVIPKVALYAGNRRIAGDSNIYTLSADWAVSELWVLHLAQQTDFRKDQGLRTSVGVRRVWHDFVLEVDLENDRIGDEFSVKVNLVPAFLWTAPTSEEKLGNLDYEARRWYR